MAKNETIHERITELVNAFGNGKNTAFASLIGSNEANVRGYRTTVMPKFDFLEKIARSLDINLKWLLTGEGTMIIKRNEYNVSYLDNDSALIAEDKSNMYRATPISRINNFNSTISIPIVDISVAAGINGCINSDNLDVIDNINLPASMIKSNARYFCVRTKGESMAPTILDSSYVILRSLEPQEWQDMPERQIYVVSDKEGRSYLKRIKNRLSQGFIVCMSDNVDKANYPNFNLQADEINCILHAEWYFSAKMPNINETYYKRISELEDRFDELENAFRIKNKA